MTRRTRYLVIAGAALALLTLALWRGNGRALDVETAVVVRGDFEETLAEDGRTRARWHVDLTAPVTGEWRPAALKVGDSVRTGTLLGLLGAAPNDPATARQVTARVGVAAASLAAAVAAEQAAVLAAAEAERARDRAERLMAAGGVSDERLEQSRAEAFARARELEAARARVAAARYERDAARALSPGGADAPVRIASPAAGVILRIDEEHDRVVAAGTPLMQVGTIGAPEVVARVLSADASRVRPGAPLTVISGRDTLRGRVTRVEPAAMTVRSPLGVDEQRVNVIGDLDGAHGLGHDFQIDVRIVVDRRSGVLTLPAGALVRNGAAWSVFVVADGRARTVPVQLLARGAESAAVEGIAEGARVVVYPPEALVDGGRVR